MKFIAIDFETANRNRNSPCEIGLIKVDNNQIVEKLSFLIKPMNNEFEEYNTFIHGITSETVYSEPEFPEIYSRIIKDLNEFPLLAHNAAFDISVLRNVCDLYDLDYPETKYSCTYQMAKQSIDDLLSFNLKSVSKYFGIELEHHRAISDAEACARIALEIFKIKEINKIEEIPNKFKLLLGELSKNGFKASLSNSSSLKISDLEYDTTKSNSDHTFYGKTVVFTGTLKSMRRVDAQTMVLEIGGKCTKGITLDTNYLIIGDQDYSRFSDGVKSTKMKKAEKMLMEGREIELLSEEQFLELITEN